ncbi:DUF6867 family protein [Methylocella sp.]|uniref:DUF6867 family protein n=1 Tax=Methylocella sp. TaxID=1978226 RepID=UPI0037847A57
MTGHELLDARSLMIFLGLSVVLGGATAAAAGRALALNWSPAWLGALYAALIAAAARFLHYALYAEPLLSPAGSMLDLAAALVFLGLGFVFTRRRQMKTHYAAVLARDPAP